MISTSIESHIHYRHSPEETAELERAIIPMAEHVKAVASPQFRTRIRKILKGEYFRYHEARTMRAVLLRASKHAKANLSEFFPTMRSEVLINAQILENAANAYWEAFRQAQATATPML
jgi:hypothetical protein